MADAPSNFRIDLPPQPPVVFDKPEQQEALREIYNAIQQIRIRLSQIETFVGGPP